MNIIDPKIVDPPKLKFEDHWNIPFGGIPVLGMGLPEVRKSVSEWWQPDWKRYSKRLCQLLSRIPPRGLCRTLAISHNPVEISIDVIIDYPLLSTWSCSAVLDAREFGSVFSLAYDLYQHVYGLDDLEWKSRGHSVAPHIQNLPGNRSRGSHVWGHDLRDLTFEALRFSPETSDPLDPTITYDAPVRFGTVAFSIGS